MLALAGTISALVPHAEEMAPGADYRNMSARVKARESTAARLTRIARENAAPPAANPEVVVPKPPSIPVA